MPAGAELGFLVDGFTQNFGMNYNLNIAKLRSSQNKTIPLKDNLNNRNSITYIVVLLKLKDEYIPGT